jgi:hypothetical protein
MTATVFTTPAPRFHETPLCPARISAQLLNDWDCDCSDLCGHRSPVIHAVREIPLTEATEQGKRPCRACYRTPELARSVLLPSREKYGHRPAIGITDPLGRGIGRVCVTCRVQGDPKRRVAWPCTSAIVLGLVARPETT